MKKLYKVQTICFTIVAANSADEASALAERVYGRYDNISTYLEGIPYVDEVKKLDQIPLNLRHQYPATQNEYNTFHFENKTCEEYLDNLLANDNIVILNGKKYRLVEEN